MNVIIRRYRPEDLESVRELEARVDPYRPEDQTAVEAMVGRAREAERTGNPRWMPQTPAMPGPERAGEDYLALWVAEARDDDGRHRVVGLVGVGRAGNSREAPAGLLPFDEWRQRDDVAELCRLRVTPETQRQGIATRLNRTAIEWCWANGFRSLVLNTTSAQIPALELYRKLGFEEVARSFVGRYELVWMALALHGP